MSETSRIEQALAKRVPIQRNMFRRLKIGRTLLLSAILPMLPLAVLAYFFLESVNTDLTFARLEVDGVTYYRELESIGRLIAEHSAESAVRPGSPAALERLKGLRAEIATHAAAMDDHVARIDAAAPERQGWTTVKRSLAGLEALAGLAPEASVEQHATLLAAISSLRTTIADRYNITLDPSADTYYLLDAAVQKAPELEIAAGQLRARVALALDAGKVTPDTWRAVVIAAQQVQDQLDGLTGDVKSAAAASPAVQALAARLGQPLDELRHEVTATLGQVDHDVAIGAASSTAAAAIEPSAALARRVTSVQAPLSDGARDILAGRAHGLERKRLLVLAITLAGVALSVGLLVAVLRIVRMSTASDAAVRSVVQAALDGDLSRRADYSNNNVFSEMVRGVNGLMDKMQAVIDAAHGSAAAVVAGMSELAQSNSDLGARTESAASSLEETAASMEQMTATVTQNAENAKQAHEIASAAREQAERGGEVVRDAVGAMREITSSSKRIAEIVGVIDEIAFQTNLLALNAAVEAARAGEQGRGFAVVASEVRSLAGRSATAAKEIKSLILDSVAKVEQGSQLVEASGERLGDIVRSVKRVTDVVAEISAASGEQSAGINQVNEAVIQLDQMTQRNAGFIEQSTHLTSVLKSRSEDLIGALSYYVRDDGAAVAAAAGPKRRGSAHVGAASAASRSSAVVSEHGERESAAA